MVAYEPWLSTAVNVLADATTAFAEFVACINANIFHLRGLRASVHKLYDCM